MATGSEWLARAIASTGTTHVFFMDAVLRRTLIALEGQGVQRVLGHSEKAVAYMADGHARVAGRPAFCFAQSVGAANLAASLQDPLLARSPVVAAVLTGRKQVTLATSQRLPGDSRPRHCSPRSPSSMCEVRYCRQPAAAATPGDPGGGVGHTAPGTASTSTACRCRSARRVP